MEAEIEKLIPEEEVVKEEEAAAQESTAEDKAKETDETTKLKAENERLRKANQNLNRKVKEVEKPKEEVQEDPTDPLSTREGWLAKIEEVAEKKSNEKFAKIREANLKRAKDRFVASHPEYAASDKLRSVLEKASLMGLASKDDETDMNECLLDAWAVENRKELEQANQERTKARERAQRATISATSSSSSERVEDDFSEAERDEAAKHKMSPERYRQAERMLEETSTVL